MITDRYIVQFCIGIKLLLVYELHYEKVHIRYQFGLFFRYMILLLLQASIKTATRIYHYQMHRTTQRGTIEKDY